MKQFHYFALSALFFAGQAFASGAAIPKDKIAAPDDMSQVTTATNPDKAAASSEALKGCENILLQSPDHEFTYRDISDNYRDTGKTYMGCAIVESPVTFYRGFWECEVDCTEFKELNQWKCQADVYGRLDSVAEKTTSEGFEPGCMPGL